MYKAMVLIKKKRGMSRQHFIKYYENHHAPLGISKVPNLRRYIRHYISPFGNDVYAADEDSPYDVLTEIWFDDEQEFRKGMEYLSDPETARLIGEDEERLFERSSIRFMIMEDHETPASSLSGASR